MVQIRKYVPLPVLSSDDERISACVFTVTDIHQENKLLASASSKEQNVNKLEEKGQKEHVPSSVNGDTTDKVCHSNESEKAEKKKKKKKKIKKDI